MITSYLKPAVATLAVASLLSAAPLGAEDAPAADSTLAQAQDPEQAEDKEAQLLARLRDADPTGAQLIERELRLIWSRSGSPAMDLLLKRGRDALEAGEIDTAIGHLSALVDHAPAFAEGYHLRAQAFYADEELGLALADLEQVLSLNPNHFNAAFGLASILEQIGFEEAAHAGYQAVLEVDPTHEEAQKGIDRLARGVAGRDI